LQHADSFRWRYRFLRLPCEVQDRALVGVVEADETYVLRSFKGQRPAVQAAGGRWPDKSPGDRQLS
jgi:hypothetical protein